MFKKIVVLTYLNMKIALLKEYWCDIFLVSFIYVEK